MVLIPKAKTQVTGNRHLGEAILRLCRFMSFGVSLFHIKGANGVISSGEWNGILSVMILIIMDHNSHILPLKRPSVVSAGFLYLSQLIRLTTA